MNGLLIGRFQPFHLGHLDAINFALTKVDILYLGLGSSNVPIHKNNPFSADERKEMILSSLDNITKEKIKIYYIPDFNDHQKWIEFISSNIPKFDIIFTNDPLTEQMYDKKGIDSMQIPFTERDVLSGTNIREKIVTDQNWTNLVPEGTKQFLLQINAKERLKIL